MDITPSTLRRLALGHGENAEGVTGIITAGSLSILLVGPREATQVLERGIRQTYEEDKNPKKSMLDFAYTSDLAKMKNVEASDIPEKTSIILMDFVIFVMEEGTETVARVLEDISELDRLYVVKYNICIVNWKLWKVKEKIKTRVQDLVSIEMRTGLHVHVIIGDNEESVDKNARKFYKMFKAVIRNPQVPI